MKNKKIFNTLSALGITSFAAIPTAFVVACNPDSNNNNNTNNNKSKIIVSDPAKKLKSMEKNDKIKDWDTNLQIHYRWYNPGFKNTQIQSDFEKFITDKFNEIKNADEDLKSLPDVSIVFKETKDKDITLTDLNTNKTDMDFAALPYHFLKEKMQQESDLDNLQAQIVSQSETLKFLWSDVAGNATYMDMNGEKLMKGAEKENEIQFSAPYGEFPTWTDSSNSPYYFDGSKYQAFYVKDDAKDNLTLIYHGAIYIAGDENTRNTIKHDWDTKNYDAFIKHGITYDKSTSGGGFKYQAALISQHFNKTLHQVYLDLTSDTSSYKDYILKGKEINGTIGKDQSGKTYNIAFGDEGQFNWTPKSWGADLFKPTNFPNSVVRVLTLTNPAPYDLLLARSGMNKAQVAILQQVFKQMSIADNKFGIYTGMNKFIPANMELVKQLYKVQSYAEQTDLPVAQIPTIEIK